MSEESSNIVEQKEKKDPRRVEGGKRLAAYNKAAREKMNATHSNTLSVENTSTETEDNKFTFPLLLVGVVGISGLVYFYFDRFYSVLKNVENNTTKQEEKKPKTRIRSFD